jgi:predicted nuclease of predicted toxin-antitoxin system
VSSFFICLYLDEDVNCLIAELLRARGFDAVSARDAGQLHATDADQFAYAVSQGRTIVTHNRVDFEQLVQAYFDSGQMHYGVIFAVRRSPQEIAQRLLVILNQVTADEMQNQVRYTQLCHWVGVSFAVFY